MTIPDQTVVWEGDLHGGTEVITRIRRLDEHNLLVEEAIPGSEWEAADDETAARAYEQALLKEIGQRGLPQGTTPHDPLRAALDSFLKGRDLQDLPVEWDDDVDPAEAALWAKSVGLTPFRVEPGGITLFARSEEELILALRTPVRKEG